MTETAVVKHEEAPPAEMTPAGLLQLAVQQGADLDKLEKLMALQERWEANEARKAYVAALSAFKADPPTVRKSKSASFGSGKAAYDYATLDRVVDVIAPALAHHDLSHNWSVSQGETGISVTCTLTHVMGHSESVTLQAPADTSGSKNAIQAIGSTVTYLQRYSLLAITGLAAADMDDDAGAGGNLVLTDEQAAELKELIREKGADTKAFLEFFKVASVDELPQSKFKQARTMLQQKRRAA